MDIVEVYTDIITPSNRTTPEFDAMLKRIEDEPGEKVLLTSDASKVSRDTYTFLNVYKQLQTNNCALHTVHQGSFHIAGPLLCQFYEEINRQVSAGNDADKSNSEIQNNNHIQEQSME